MNASRAESILQNQSGLCRRFFKVVPIQTAWTWQEIVKELARVEGGSEPTRAIALGCLTTLASVGLVREKPLGSFQSLVKPNNPVIKEPVMAQAATAPLPATAQMAQVFKPSLLDRLAEKAEQLRDMAEDLDTLAVEITEQLSSVSEDSQKLKELQATLKKLMG